MPRRGASNEYPQHKFLSRNKKNIDTFWLKKSDLSRAMGPDETEHARDDFVCVEVLRPSQPNGVMSSAVSLPIHVYWAGLVL